MSGIIQSFTVVPNVFRNVFENCDIMVNNDERVFYSIVSHTEEEFYHEIKKRLVFSRPVYKEENLDPTLFGGLDSIKTSDLTKLLDSAYKLLFAARKFEKLLSFANKKFDLEEFLPHYIGFNYYDCLTGGMDTNIYWFCVELCERIDPEIEIYCDSKVKDFLATAKGKEKPELTNILKLINISLRGLIQKWCNVEMGGEVALDGEITPKLEGDYYAKIITDGRTPDSVVCWESGGFYLKSTY